jgi:hypothetical protein
MNINDYEAPPFTKDWLHDIFEKQKQLIIKYADIEKMPEWPMSIHTREGQKWIKDFLWRVSEEMAESYEAFVFIGKELNEEKIKLHTTHNIEELIDALHFLVELIILVDRDADWARVALDSKKIKIELAIETPAQAYWAVIYYLGLVGNTLKNKPWKKTEMQTDDEKFYSNLAKAFKALFICMEVMGANEETVFNFYARKNQVNQFRQRSNY